MGEEKEKGGLGERDRVIHVQPPTLIYLLGNEILSRLETVVGTVYQWCYSFESELYHSHCSTAFKLMSKGRRTTVRRCISRCSARSTQNTGKIIDARYHQTPNVYKCVYLTSPASALLAISAVRARMCTKRRDPSRRAGREDGRKRERLSEREVNT